MLSCFRKDQVGLENVERPDMDFGNTMTYYIGFQYRKKRGQQIFRIWRGRWRVHCRDLCANKDRWRINGKRLMRKKDLFASIAAR